MDEYPSHRSMRGKIATGLIIALGMLIALAGVAIDYILPGTSPGLNLPQLVIIAAGLTVSYLAPFVVSDDQGRGSAPQNRSAGRS